MAEYFKNLNRVEFIITPDCNGRCIHCSQGNHCSSGLHIDADAACKALSELNEKYNLQSIMTFGGEALLYPDCVFAIHTRAAKLKIPKRQFITNGYFSNNTEKIKSVVNGLKISQVNDILLSVDAFHQEYIPIEPVLTFAKEILNLDLPLRLNPAWLVSYEDDNPYNTKTRELIEMFKKLGVSESDGNVIFPEGNALKYLSEYFNSEKEYVNPYEENPMDIRSISIEADNTAFGKSTIKYSIIEILESYRT